MILIVTTFENRNRHFTKDPELVPAGILPKPVGILPLHTERANQAAVHPVASPPTSHFDVQCCPSCETAGTWIYVPSMPESFFPTSSEQPSCMYVSPLCASNSRLDSSTCQHVYRLQLCTILTFLRFLSADRLRRTALSAYRGP